MRTSIFYLMLAGAVWSAALWAVLAFDQDAPAPRQAEVDVVVPAAQATATVEPPSQPVAASSAVRAEPSRRILADSHRPRSMPLADQPPPPANEVPDAFPLSEPHWRDADPQDAWLEPDLQAPVTRESEPLDNPWGGEWSDQGGS
ncbi:hypothetical protein [Thiocystis violacea]|uniref:hypothetical protein n=1 Tax=Thiocystis violacea TaxID=13725 RepID=UPI001904CAC8|nr:hypothetical protein [Thiocystis violacea]MBK1723102.1 hypothetical protein [Thiocystis violacea]